jgi:Putative beta barrel porin-7 (BBP7)
MKRKSCGASLRLLTGIGLALCLHATVFGQSPRGPSTFVIDSPQAVAKDPGVPPETVTEPPIRGMVEPASFDFGGTDKPRQWYASADYLLWWFKDSPVPVPLLTTTSNPASMPVAAINDLNTRVILGNESLGGGVHQGARFALGWWIDDSRQIGLEGGYFFLADKTTVRSAASSGQPDAPVLAVPFFDEDAGAENSFLVASPGGFAGAAVLSLTSGLHSAELQGVVQAFDATNLHVEVLVGGRFAELTENLSFATSSIGISDPNTDLILNTVDRFNVRNDFYGWQVGTRAEAQWGNFEFRASAKLALGDMHQVVNRSGFAVTNFFNAPAGGPFTGVPTQIVPGSGAFVQQSNLGRVSRDCFAVAPELGVTLGYRVTDAIRVSAGYDFFYLSNALRPGNQIDRGINFSQTVQSTIAGNAAAAGSRPAATLTDSDFWAQGLRLGLELRY